MSRLAKWQTAGIKFTQWLKNSIFDPQWRLVAPIHVKFALGDRYLGPLGRAMFHLNRCTRMGTRYGKDSPRWGEPLTDFSKVREFYVNKHTAEEF